MKRRWVAAAAVLLVGASSPPASPSAPTFDVRLAPSSRGWLGAWLLIGPYRSATYGQKPPPPGVDPLAAPPEGADEATLRPLLGTSWGAARWTLASSAEGPIDVRAALHATESDILAYAAGTLHLAEAGRIYLLVGADDGLRVSVDGKPVLSRDEPRPERDDDDVVPLDLPAGDHPVVLKLHQRDGAWSFHARVLDGELRPPRGSYLWLPGTTVDDARDLASRMSWVSVDRGASGDGYHPALTVRFPEGAPLGLPLDVNARLVQAPLARATAALDPAAFQTSFEVSAGKVPVDERGVGELKTDLPALDVADIKDVSWTFEVRVSGRVVRTPFFPRRFVEKALAHAERTLEPLAPASSTPPSWLRSGSLESLELARSRIESFASHADGDLEAQAAEAKDLDLALASIDAKTDPYATRTGLMRRAYRSPVDGELAEFGLYVPPSYRRGDGKRYPLIVVLHGLNGRPMAMIRYFFGGDDPKRENEWEDRHPLDPMPNLEAFVVAPSGHGNTMYRDLGEDDVMRVIAWAESAYPIDQDRVTITGPSMGGIGSAGVPLHHPDVFAAAAPLCGYQSYFVRRDVLGRPIRPWEKVLAEEKSNVEWATNGERLPLWIVHGTLDQPEANSGVLIKRYEELKYSIVHDHPELGHNVWQTTYEGLKGADWLLQFRRDRHPSRIHFRTVRLRDGDDAWLHVDELAAPDAWAEVDARVRSRTRIDVEVKGAGAFHLDRDDRLVDRHRELTVMVNGTRVVFAADDPLSLHAEGDGWKAGPAHHEGLYKHGNVTGPIRDAFHEPLLFVYGAADPSVARANEEVARAWAQIRYGVTVRYPIMSDAEFFAANQPLANDRSLFLVGNARSNRVVRELEAGLPIRIDGESVLVGSERFTGRELGAAFVRPNPKRPDRYLVVVEGVDAPGTWRSLSLPDLLPDFIVYDVSVAPARGQVLLGAGMARAAGFFQNDWSLPATIADPLARQARALPPSEHDATPYLP